MGYGKEMLCKQVYNANLHKSYYEAHPKRKKIGVKTAIKYTAGPFGVPKYLVKFYSREDGWASAYTDTTQITQACCSMLRVWDMQQRVHQWLHACSLPLDVIKQLEATIGRPHTAAASRTDFHR